MCKLDISLNCNKCSMRDQYSNATREGVNSSTRKAWAGAPQEAVGAEPRKAIWSYSCSTRPGMEWSNTTVVPGWVTSLMEPELGAWFFIFLFIHLCIYIVWPCGSLFHSVVDLSSNTAQQIISNLSGYSNKGHLLSLTHQWVMDSKQLVLAQVSDGVAVRCQQGCGPVNIPGAGGPTANVTHYTGCQGGAVCWWKAYPQGCPSSEHGVWGGPSE